MNEIVLNKLRLNFKDIEKEIFGIVCQELYQPFPDDWRVRWWVIGGKRKKRYKYKFKTEKTIQTVMEELVFNKRYYLDKHTKEGAYLLDKILDLNLLGRTSQNLIEKNKLDYLSVAIEKLESDSISKCLNKEANDDNEVAIPFEEKDDAYLRIQGKNPKEETKLVNLYEGWIENRGRYRTLETM